MDAEKKPQKRTGKTVVFTVTDADAVQIEKAAIAAHLPRAVFARKVVLDSAASILEKGTA